MFLEPSEMIFCSYLKLKKFNTLVKNLLLTIAPLALIAARHS